MQSIEPSIYMCDTMFYYQITGDKDAIINMINCEVNNKLRSYYCGTLKYPVAPLFDIKYRLNTSMFEKIYETYDLLINQ